MRAEVRNGVPCLRLLSNSPRHEPVRRHAGNVVALEETEVLEIGYAAMKQVFDTNPNLVESLSFIMAERRQGLAPQTDSDTHSTDSSKSLLSAIKRFFRLSQ